MSKYSDCSNKEFDLTFNKTEVKEGRSFNTTLESSKCHADRKVFWTISGKGITTDDFIDQDLSGSDTLNSRGTYKLKIDVKKDGKKEGTETLKLEYFIDKSRKKKVAEESIKIIDTSYKPEDLDNVSPDQPYTLAISRPQVKENVHISVNVKNGEPGKIVYFSLSGKGVDKNDIDLNYARTKGEAVIQNKGNARIPFLLRDDNKTEGKEMAIVTIYKNKKRTKKLDSITFPIVDTSKETLEQGPTTSVDPGTKQPQWGPTTQKGTWFTFSPSRPEIKENNSTRTRIDSNSRKNRSLYFNLSGEGINKNDLDLSYARTKGKAITNSNGVAFIPHLLRNDNKTEGTEEMTITLYSDKNRKKQLTATTVPIIDTSIETPEQGPTGSKNPGTDQIPWTGGEEGGTWFTLSPNRVEYQDNEPIKTRIDSDSLPGKTVYYQLSGAGITSEALDTSNGLGGMTGEAFIGKNGLANIQHLVKEDKSSFQDRELTIDLYRDRKKTKQVASTTVPIQNTTVRPDITISSNTNSINEGKGVKFQVFTEGYSQDQDFYWDIEGFNVNTADFVPQTTLSGTSKRDPGKRKFNLEFVTEKDKFTEGEERFNLFIYSDPNKETLIGESDTIIINDTSTTPQKTVNLTANPSSVKEGKSFKVNIKTKNIGEGTPLYWSSSGTASSNDIVLFNDSPANNGTAIIDANGKSLIEFKTIADGMTEENELFTLSTFSDINLTNSIGDPVSVTIMDTQNPVPTNNPSDNNAEEQNITIVANTKSEPNNTVNEGKGVKFQVFTEGFSRDQDFYWEIMGLNVNESDFVPQTFLSGTSQRDPGKQKFLLDFDTSKDNFTEGQEEFNLFIYSDSTKTDLIGKSETIILNDTSTTPKKIVNLTANPSFVKEGKDFDINVKTKNIDPGTQLFWKGAGTADTNDIVLFNGSLATSGAVAVDTNGRSVINFEVAEDYTTEGDELFTLTTFHDANFLSPASDSISVIIRDTSQGI